jgi:hypothetical protein
MCRTRVPSADETRTPSRTLNTAGDRATQEVVPCSGGIRGGSRHVSSFPPQWRQPRRHNRRSREEEGRPGAAALQLPRRRHHPRRARLRPRTPRRPRVRRPLRRHRHHAPRPRWQRRGMRRRKLLLRRGMRPRKLPRPVTRLHKPPRRARLRKRHALRRSSLPVLPAAHPLRLRPPTRRRRRPRRLPRSSSRRRSPDGAAAVDPALRNRPRAKT